MTTVDSSVSCTFSDALYVTADDDKSSKEDASSEYFTANTHQSTSIDDSGLSCTPPYGCLLSSGTIDTDLLEETLEGEMLSDFLSPARDEREEIINDEKERKSSANSNSFIIVSTSHMRHKSSSSSFNETRSGRSSRCSESISSQFNVDPNDDFFVEQPSMEYEDAFVPCAQSSPTKAEQKEREKIFIRELSFDELQDVKGVDLMAPVFLAVTNDADDNVYDLQRKCKSIEDLCSVINQEMNDLEDSRKRSKSAFNIPRRRIHKLSPLFMADEENSKTELDFDTSLDGAKDRLASLNTSLKSHLSYEDVSRLPSSPGNQSCNASTDYEMPNDEDCLPSPSAFSFSKVDNINESELKHEDFKFNTNVPDLIRSPERVQGSNCGFWEYPYGSPTSPPPSINTKSPVNEIRSPGLNTSPQSSQPSSSTSDRFVVVNVAGQQRIVDMKLIEDYLKILTHGGHHTVAGERRVIVVFNAYYLPKRNIPKYNIVMEQLFYYCVHAVDLMVMDSYEIVFFNSAMNGTNIPSRQLIKQCYDMIQYRLKKNLQNIYFVHPSLLLKTVLKFTHFFVSAKFARKMHYVKNLKALKSYLPLEYIFVSSEIKQLERKFT